MVTLIDAGAPGHLSIQWNNPIIATVGGVTKPHGTLWLIQFQAGDQCRETMFRV